MQNLKSGHLFLYPRFIHCPPLRLVTGHEHIIHFQRSLRDVSEFLAISLSATGDNSPFYNQGSLIGAFHGLEIHPEGLFGDSGHFRCRLQPDSQHVLLHEDGVVLLGGESSYLLRRNIPSHAESSTVSRPRKKEAISLARPREPDKGRHRES